MTDPAPSTLDELRREDARFWAAWDKIHLEEPRLRVRALFARSAEKRKKKVDGPQRDRVESPGRLPRGPLQDEKGEGPLGRSR